MTRPPNKKTTPSRSSIPAAGLQTLNLWRNYIFVVGLVFITLLTYRPVWHETPLMDDQTYLIAKSELRSVSGLVSLWIEPQKTKQYHPLVDTGVWIRKRLWGQTTMSSHLVTILQPQGTALHSASELI